ncbi:ABC transporter permease [Nonomuraea jiangxiensis]|uniref:ABC-type nitrate/sulfonate/bicarbonate transport system, permease component n=1 Tax=Nonomuraea jiangxiensis TaxID=633440 RepID=A0A1G8W7F5_9ACTN|nr:ABC transporter permease [Nonomuraea jiangxiensis]SDJ74208.1 ABC-type nitrate/sulfonate/bicarbonate transport system, permease component [Nonomuraea jiangxiensis]
MVSLARVSAGRGSDLGLKVAGIAVALLLVELCTRSGLLPERWFPPAGEIYAEFFRLAGGRPLWVEIGRTLLGWATGLGLGAVLAVPIGMALGSSRTAYRLSRVVIEFCRPVPPVALIPLTVLVYGTDLQTKTFLVAFAVFWPMLFQTIYGVQDVDPVAIDTARAYGLGTFARFRTVVLPSATPYIATGLRISSSIALILAITEELVVGTPGLGRAIIVAQSAGDPTRMYALIIATGLLGWALNAAFGALERRVLSWHPAQRQEVAR